MYFHLTKFNLIWWYTEHVLSLWHDFNVSTNTCIGYIHFLIKIYHMFTMRNRTKTIIYLFSKNIKLSHYISWIATFFFFRYSILAFKSSAKNSEHFCMYNVVKALSIFLLAFYENKQYLNIQLLIFSMLYYFNMFVMSCPCVLLKIASLRIFF